VTFIVYHNGDPDQDMILCESCFPFSGYTAGDEADEDSMCENCGTTESSDAVPNDPLIIADVLAFLQASEEEVLEERRHDDGWLEGDEQVEAAYENRLAEIRTLHERVRKAFA
jgi:hypothetical protein